MSALGIGVHHGGGSMPNTQGRRGLDGSMTRMT